MVGVIRKRDVLAHPMVTIQCFGWRVFLRALAAGRNQTFLSLIMASGVLERIRVQVPELVERCIQLELAAVRMYERLAQKFFSSLEARDLFLTLARQEREHAELLKLCREAASRERWDEKTAEPFAEALPGLERTMRDAEAGLDRIQTLDEALALVVQIEGSEVNRVFQGIVAATDSCFVRALDVFRAATREHIEFIAGRVPEIAPGLEEACRTLQGRHPLQRAGG